MDPCPDLFVVDIVNLMPEPGEFAWVWLEPAPQGVTQAACESAISRTSVGDPNGLVPLTSNVLRLPAVWIEEDCQDIIVCDPSFCTIPGQIFFPSDIMTLLGGSIRVATSVVATMGTVPTSLGVTDTTQGFQTCDPGAR